ncbi:MAG: pyocin activator PrtN family protein [Clostridia bacterium]|nr:pyocin activator PrtN family protein [Clostridia bacterium]
MEYVAYQQNLKLLRVLFPDKFVISVKECAGVLGVDPRTVRDMAKRVNNRLPLVRLTYSKKSRYGISLSDLARWIELEGQRIGV